MQNMLSLQCASGSRVFNNVKPTNSLKSSVPARFPVCRCVCNSERVVEASLQTCSSSSSSSLASPVHDLARSVLAVCKPGDSKLLILAAALVGIAALVEPGQALAVQDYHQHPQLLGDFAEDTGFWTNVLRYISYFFSVLLGTAYVALRPLVELFKRPTTAILAIGGVVGLLAFVSFTVNAMLGVNEPFEYNP